MPTLNEHSGIIHVGNGGSPFVPGAWVPLIASAIRDSSWSILYLAPDVALGIPSGTGVFIDLAIGAMGSEVIILNDAYMQIGATTDFNDSYHDLELPLRFQLGDRISARIKDNASFGVTYDVGLRNFE